MGEWREERRKWKVERGERKEGRIGELKVGGWRTEIRDR
jgi:hypothetical protein